MFRPSIAASMVLLLLSTGASQAASKQPLMTGMYIGTYTCAQGETKARMFLGESPGGGHEGTFTFYHRGLSPKFKVQLIDRGEGRFTMLPDSPVSGGRNYTPVGAELVWEGGVLSGRVTHPDCGAISMKWDNGHIPGLTVESFNVIVDAVSTDMMYNRWRDAHCKRIPKPGSTPNDPDFDEVCDPNAPPPPRMKSAK